MSHFTTLVLVDARKGDPVSQAEQLLAPYDENITVKEYDEKCGCVGRIALGQAREFATAKVGSLDSFREKFHKQFKDGSDDDWKKFIKPFTNAQHQSEAKNPFYMKPDPKCNECRGSGKRKTTYNQKSKWDCYELGGRWSGELGGKNVAPISEVKDFVPFAIVTPDGKWHEKGHMGWWAMVSEENRGWDEQAKAILDSHKDCVALLYDLHI